MPGSSRQEVRANPPEVLNPPRTLKEGRPSGKEEGIARKTLKNANIKNWIVRRNAKEMCQE